MMIMMITARVNMTIAILKIINMIMMMMSMMMMKVVVDHMEKWSLSGKLAGEGSWV